jgi:hypothetical protein
MNPKVKMEIRKTTPPICVTAVSRQMNKRPSNMFSSLISSSGVAYNGEVSALAGFQSGALSTKPKVEQDKT